MLLGQRLAVRARRPWDPPWPRWQHVSVARGRHDRAGAASSSTRATRLRALAADYLACADRRRTADRTVKATLDAIATPATPDPFSVLGPHLENGRLTIRACFPTAESVSVVRNGPPPVPMTRTHPAGIYEAALPERHDASTSTTACASRIRVIASKKSTIPYRYGRVITDFDLYLFGEGQPHAHLRQARRASDDGRLRRPACTSRSGRPTPTRVSVVGDFNGWDGRVHPMRRLGAERRLGDLHPGRARSASATSSRSARGTASCCSRPIRSASRSRCRR